MARSKRKQVTAEVDQGPAAVPAAGADAADATSAEAPTEPLAAEAADPLPGSAEDPQGFGPGQPGLQGGASGDLEQGGGREVPKPGQVETTSVQIKKLEAKLFPIFNLSDRPVTEAAVEAALHEADSAWRWEFDEVNATAGTLVKASVDLFGMEQVAQLRRCIEWLDTNWWIVRAVGREDVYKEFLTHVDGLQQFVIRLCSIDVVAARFRVVPDLFRTGTNAHHLAWNALEQCLERRFEVPQADAAPDGSQQVVGGGGGTVGGGAARKRKTSHFKTQREAAKSLGVSASSVCRFVGEPGVRDAITVQIDGRKQFDAPLMERLFRVWEKCRETRDMSKLTVKLRDLTEARQASPAVARFGQQPPSRR